MVICNGILRSNKIMAVFKISRRAFCGQMDCLFGRLDEAERTQQIIEWLCLIHPA